MTRSTCPLLLLACALGGALAQEPPPELEPPPVGPNVREAIGAALAAARESGALEKRLLGSRWFHFVRPGRFEALIEVVGESLPGGGLACEMRATMIKGRRQDRMIDRSELGPGGELRRVRIELTEGDTTSQAEGELRDGQLVVSRQRAGREPREKRVEWGDDAVPFAVAAFFLPCLHDQGLPAALTLRVFEGEDVRLRKRGSLHQVAAEPVSEGELRLKKVTLEGSQGWVALVREDGAIHRLTVDGQDMVAVSGEQAEALRKAAAEAPAEPEAPEAEGPPPPPPPAPPEPPEPR